MYVYIYIYIYIYIIVFKLFFITSGVQLMLTKVVYSLCVIKLVSIFFHLMKHLCKYEV